MRLDHLLSKENEAEKPRQICQRFLTDELGTLFNFLCPSQLSADEQRKIGQNKTDPYGGIAQLGEHLPCKQGVMSSNLIISTTFGRAKAYLRGNPNLENQITRKRKDEKTKGC